MKVNWVMFLDPVGLEPFLAPVVLCEFLTTASSKVFFLPPIKKDSIVNKLLNSVGFGIHTPNDFVFHVVSVLEKE